MGKFLLTKKYGANYAGQVMTGVEKGSIPAQYGRYYEDNEPTPMDVVKDPNQGPSNPLSVVNDEMDIQEVNAADADQKAKLKAAKEVGAPAAGDLAAGEQEDTQRRAREADQFAAKAAKKGAGGKGDKRTKSAKARAGKEHGVK
jgi:hypothetical protein